MSGTGTPTTTGGIRAEHDSATISLYNNTVVLFVSNYSFGNTCTVVLKNNIANDSGTNGYLLGTGCTTTGSITNLSDKADTFGTSGINSTDLTFVSPGTTAWDYHLAAGDTAAIGVGTNLTATFTTDIDGVTRPAVAAWDLGADQTVSAASALRLLADKMGAMPTEI